MYYEEKKIPLTVFLAGQLNSGMCQGGELGGEIRSTRYYFVGIGVWLAVRILQEGNCMKKETSAWRCENGL